MREGWLKLAHLTDGSVRSLYIGPPARVHWSPDGKRILLTGYKPGKIVTVGSGSIEEAARGDGVPFWAATGELVRLAMPDGFYTPSPDLRYAFSMTGNHLTVWDTRANREAMKVLLSSLAQVSSVAWLPDSRHLAAMIDEVEKGEGIVEVWDVVAARPTERWTASGRSWSGSLMWRDKLTVLQDLGGAVRIWRAP